MTNAFKPDFAWKTVLLKAIPIIAYLIFLFVYQSKLSIYLKFMTSLALLVPCIFAIYSFVRTNYIINEEGYLFVRHGFAVRKLNIADITSIKPIRGVSFGQWFRTYALSTEGLSIMYGTNEEIIVSPEKKERFIIGLQNLNKTILLNN